MNRLTPHPQNRTPQQRPILRAFVMGVALCLLGVALYVQTNSIIFVVGGAAIGALATFNALKSRPRTPKRQATKPAPFKTVARKNPPPTNTSSDLPSNVTPFRRPAPKQPENKSNRPSA